MNRLHGSICLVSCAVVTLVVGLAGCSGGGKTIAGTALVIDFELPQNTPEATGARYCNGAHSIVLAIDEGNDAEPFDHVLLLDTSYRLYGCGGAGEPCNRGVTLRHDFTPPVRVIAEWVDVPPEQYAAGPSNVICRGLYDAASNMGTLTVTPDDSLITVVIPLLRVGAMNGYFSAFSPGTQPTGTFLGVSPLVLATDLVLVNGSLRDDEGGKILAAGGLVSGTAQTGLYVFEPDNLGFTLIPNASLPVGRAALSATAFATDDTNHFVLLTGGAGTNMLSTTGSWIFTGDDDTGMLLTGPPMKSPRAHHSATYVTGFADLTSLKEGIVMLGGCNLDGSGADQTSSDVEVFLSSPPDDPAFSCQTPANGGVFCLRSPTSPLPQACQFSVGRVDRTDSSEETILWVGGGGRQSLPNQSGSSDLDRSFQDSYVRPVVFPGLRGSATSTTTYPNSFLVVGGDAGAFGAGGVASSTDEVFFVSGVTGLATGTPTRVANLKQARAFHTATRLLDQRLLVAGGRDANGPTNSYEIGAVITTSLQFAFESVLAGPPCDADSTGMDCSAMSEARAEHSAEIIRGSATWLNGSVVLVGGSDSALPEIYVPAYACDATGLLPVAVLGSAQTVISDEVDFCDRGRMPFLPIMDPSTGLPN